MIKLNRTTEYGLIALRHMQSKKNQRKNSEQLCEVTSAREVADYYGLPFEITAKTLQKMKDNGLIQSAQGARGGYTLNRSLDELTLAEFLSFMEGPQALVACVPPFPTLQPSEHVTSDCSCEYQNRCEMKNVMKDLNSRIFKFLNGIRLGDLAQTVSRPSSQPAWKAGGEKAMPMNAFWGAEEP